MKFVSTKRPCTWYEPACAGNRALPKAERLAFLLDPMSIAELDTFRAPFVKGMTEGTDADQEATAKAFRNQLLAQRVREVRNGFDAEGQPLTPATFVGAVEAHNDAEWGGLLGELFSALTKASVLAEGAAGN